MLADTGPLYALVDRSDAWHERVLRWWNGNREPILVPGPVLPEVSYLLNRRIGPSAEEAFVRAVAAGEFTIQELEPEDYPRIADLVAAYQSLPLGFVDAALVALAERLEVTTLLTTDRLDFGVIRARHTERFRLVP